MIWQRSTSERTQNNNTNLTRQKQEHQTELNILTWAVCVLEGDVSIFDYIFLETCTLIEFEPNLLWFRVWDQHNSIQCCLLRFNSMLLYSYEQNRERTTQERKLSARKSNYPIIRKEIERQFSNINFVDYK